MHVATAPGILARMFRYAICGAALVVVSGCIDSRELDAWKCESLGYSPKTTQFDDCHLRLQHEREEWMERRMRANEMSSEA